MPSVAGLFERFDVASALVNEGVTEFSRTLMISELLTTGSFGNGMHLEFCLREDCDLFFRFEFILEIQEYGFFDVLEESFKVSPVGEDAMPDCVSRPASVFIGRFKSDDYDKSP